MATYNGRYYKVKVVRAKQEWRCAISNTIIPIGDHYIHITVESSVRRMGKYGSMYNETEYIRVSRETLARMTIFDILDASGKFLTDSERINKLLEENTRLKAKLRSATCKLDRLAIKVKELKCIVNRVYQVDEEDDCDE